MMIVPEVLGRAQSEQAPGITAPLPLRPAVQGRCGENFFTPRSVGCHLLVVIVIGGWTRPWNLRVFRCLNELLDQVLNYRVSACSHISL
jgi:hypothetical protein